MDHITEITISCEQCEVVEASKHEIFDSFHDDCDVNLGLHLYIEASLASRAVLLGTLHPLTLELTNIDFEAETIKLLVETFAMPDR